MLYEAITDEVGVKDAFDKLRELFEEGAEDGNKYYKCTRKLHRNCELWGAFGEQENKNRYLAMFGRDETGDAIFTANPLKPGSRDNYRSYAQLKYGLFVRNEKERRFLVHSGHFHRDSPQKRERLLECPNDWIDVRDVEHQFFPITPIDNIDTNTLIDKIDKFTKILEGKGREDSVRREARSALNTILYGPPGTGKTYKTFRRCVEICYGQENCPDKIKEIRARYADLVKERRIEFVTFHQSYGYEEFVEGLRPNTGPAKKGGETGAGFRLDVTPGVLKRIAKRARGAAGSTGQAEASADAEPHVLVIDEINRANVSKVMGELITLLEEDKRKGAKNEVSVTLPHSRKPFTLPANLYILGTMNTADRSIALLDTALRRRFEFEELTPEPELLETVDGIDLPAVLGAINQRLEYLIDRDHLIGHAWLMGARTKEDVDRIMRHKIIPLIAEYFYDDWQKVQAVLGGTDDFVQGESLVRPPGLGDDTDAGEDRHRWTVQKEFAKGAYGRLISGPARDSEQAQNSG